MIRHLLARNLTDRYRVAQVLQHPWITRNFHEKEPLTQGEINMQMETEIKLRKSLLTALFLGIQQIGKKSIKTKD